MDLFDLIAEADVGAGRSGSRFCRRSVAVPLDFVVDESSVFFSHLFTDFCFLSSFFSDSENIGTTFGKLLQAALDCLAGCEHLKLIQDRFQ